MTVSFGFAMPSYALVQRVLEEFLFLSTLDMRSVVVVSPASVCVSPVIVSVSLAPAVVHPWSVVSDLSRAKALSLYLYHSSCDAAQAADTHLLCCEEVDDLCGPPDDDVSRLGPVVVSPVLLSRRVARQARAAVQCLDEMAAWERFAPSVPPPKPPKPYVQYRAMYPVVYARHVPCWSTVCLLFLSWCLFGSSVGPMELPPTSEVVESVDPLVLPSAPAVAVLPVPMIDPVVLQIIKQIYHLGPSDPPSCEAALWKCAGAPMLRGRLSLAPSLLCTPLSRLSVVSVSVPQLTPLILDLLVILSRRLLIGMLGRKSSCCCILCSKVMAGMLALW